MSSYISHLLHSQFTKHSPMIVRTISITNLKEYLPWVFVAVLATVSAYRNVLPTDVLILIQVVSSPSSYGPCISLSHTLSQTFDKKSANPYNGAQTRHEEVRNMRQGKLQRGTTAAIALAIFGTLPSATATILYVANYLESITSLELTGSDLRVVAQTSGCGKVSSWLTHDPDTNRLFCMDESLPNGTVSSFETRDDGSLSRLAIVDTIGGTVASTLFGQGNGLAVAYLYVLCSVSSVTGREKKKPSQINLPK